MQNLWAQEMNSIEPNLNAIILSYLDNESLNNLAIILPKIIIDAQNTNTYWYVKSELLLNKQLDIKDYNWRNIYNLLHSVPEKEWFAVAIYNEDINTIKLLLDIGKDPTDLLGLASMYGKLEIIKLLLGDQRIKNNPKPIGKSIYWAAANSNIDVVKFLLKEKIEYDYDFNPIYVAVGYGDSAITNILLKDNRIILETEKNMIIIAAYFGYTDIIKLLLHDKRIDPSNESNRAIRDASKKGHTDIVKLLLEDSRVNPGANNNEALINAVTHNNINIVKLLIKHPSVNPADRSNSALNIAVEKNYIKIIETLLSDDNVLDNISEIPIIYKNIIIDPIKGMIIGHYFTHTHISAKYSVNDTDPADKLYNTLLRYIIIRNPNIIQVINYLIRLINKNNQWINNLKKIIHIVSYETIYGKSPYDISTMENTDINLYRILTTFFLLSFKPEYSYKEILNIIDYKYEDKEIWKLNAILLIGAFMGASKIISQNPDISNDLIQYTNRVLMIKKLP
jgi:hypothetical protein